MARIFPFSAYHYSAQAGRLSDLVTQPYDKISPDMQARYLSLSPHNLVRVILGERFPSDDDSHNVYTRAAQHLRDWIASGILVQDREPGFYAYSQEFTVPNGNEKLVRRGFIGLGALEEYEAGIVHRHEQTLSGPKRDRMDLLKHTHAHFGQIFMLYDDAEMHVERILDEETHRAPDAEVNDEYDTIHRVWRVANPQAVRAIQNAMADRKLLIADGHHRYETALAFRNANADMEAARSVMMTFVNMHSPGLRILATHRVLANVPNFDARKLIDASGARELASLAELKSVFAQPARDRLRVGIALDKGNRVYLIDRARANGDLDVTFLHRNLLEGVLGINEDAVRNESYISYVRGIEPAVARVSEGNAQAAFLLEPTPIEQVAEVAFSGGVMPQKSTDFYPKMLTGFTIYKMDA